MSFEMLPIQQPSRDYALVTIIGLSVGVLALMPFGNIGIVLTPTVIVSSIFGFTIFAPLAFYLVRRLRFFWPGAERFGKFAASGTFSALIYLAVLNVLIHLTGFSRGGYYSLFAVIAFLVSKVSGYSWNKFWTFESTTPVTTREYLRFTFFTVSGALLNVGIGSLLVNAIGAPVGFTLTSWANASAVVAIILSSLWTYFAYRHFVFRA